MRKITSWSYGSNYLVTHIIRDYGGVITTCVNINTNVINYQSKLDLHLTVNFL